tara:strand:+ start:33 stop:665 length:633 start_codon:yes stop_codon:yes gene_type:complete
MIKILPLIFLPTFFLLFFLNVKNLTSKNDININENENVPKIFVDKIKKKTQINEKDLQNIDVVEGNSEISSQIDTKSNPKISDDKQKIKKTVNENTNSSQEKSKNFQPNSKQSKVEVNSKTAVLPDKNKFNSEKKIKIQFGAFSKLNNAEKHKELVINKITTNYPNFQNNIKILSENNLYKVLYYAVNQETANKICKFSKSKKVNCLILK